MYTAGIKLRKLNKFCKNVTTRVPVYKFNMEMTCEGCSGAATRVLTKLGDKVSFEVSLADQLVTVTSSEMSAQELLEVLQKTGKTCSIKN